jgi:hypothetical protein
MMRSSYEFAGWLEADAKPAKRLHSRPMGKGGPLLLCLDTSGSMSGPREALSKALALKCISAAHGKRRQCFLYAFGGKNQLAEIRVGVERGSGLEPLLDFLCHSYNAGTDVDAPLAGSLKRLVRVPSSARWHSWWPPTTTFDGLLQRSGCGVGGCDSVLARVHSGRRSGATRTCCSSRTGSSSERNGRYRPTPPAFC